MIYQNNTAFYAVKSEPPAPPVCVLRLRFSQRISAERQGKAQAELARFHPALQLRGAFWDGVYWLWVEHPAGEDMEHIEAQEILRRHFPDGHY